MKGIILAGGDGSRLRPVTLALSKQLVPIFDKPMIYYPLSVLMLAGIRDILLIGKPIDLPHFHRLLGDGAWLGLSIDYAEQPEPRGLADAFIIGADHVGTDTAALILGDNVFHGYGFSPLLRSMTDDLKGCVLFGYPVSDPHRHGIAELDDEGNLVSIEEKPEQPKSNRAITGLYLYDNDVIEIARELRPSARGELEITDVNNRYLERDHASMIDLGRGFAWFDAGTHDSLLAASRYVHMLQERQGIQVACLEEIALRMGYIDAEQCRRLGEQLTSSGYGRYVREVAQSVSHGE